MVLMVSMVKQAIEDKRRHAADDAQNARNCRVLGRRGETIVKQWMELQVGDIVCLHSHDEAPADIFILSTAEEEGRCFVETCNLDGETNLKRRCSIQELGKYMGFRKLNDPPLDEQEHARSTMAFTGVMDYEHPNNRLYNFTGRIKISQQSTKETIPIGPSNIILRGCSIRGCPYLYGLVIFTGHETKLMQNSRVTPSKQSNVYKMVNRCILLIFATQTILCIISTACNMTWMDRNETRLWYMGSIKRTSHAADIVSFFTFLILYNNLVPISLYVSLDIVKVIQAKQIASDPEMCYENKFAIARTSDLNEELGQIEYIFSDKTGTLTRNIMEFRKCFIAGVSYGFGTTEIGRAVAELARKDAVETNIQLSGISRGTDMQDEQVSYDPQQAQVAFDPSIHFDDPRIIDALNTNSEEAAHIDEFLTILSVCHSVIPEQSKDDGTVEYRASSPDEEALVKAAKCLGYNFLTPAPVIDLLVTKKSGHSEKRTYTILNVNEFSSTRKRMSVVVRTSSNQYFVFCKGADNVMIPRSSAYPHMAQLQQELKRFASEGLRTLVLCCRELSEQEYVKWDAKYQNAVTSLCNREELLDELAEVIEVNMKIIGATAIEDKLQEGVPGAIFNLAQAGIKIWMLTGDKEETAINIGHACQLINSGMRLLTINCENLTDLTAQVNSLYESEDVQSHLRSKVVSRHLALVCDGKSLVHIFPPKGTKSTPETLAILAQLEEKMRLMSSICQAVIACRVSPAQKADIVNLIRYNSPHKAITLAIGDGANDVNMIQSAHVGVGISGQEGVQAANASDYTISQFRFLERLLLVHGRYNYHRISKVILYSFYKNVALVIALFLFNFFNGQSGTSVFESFVMAGWNFFLALPIIAVGIFYQDVSPEQALRYPKLYIAGQRNEGLNTKCFSAWILDAVIQAHICFLCVINPISNLHGGIPALYLQGTVIYAVLLLSANLKVAIETDFWTKYNFSVLSFSVVFFLSFLVIFPTVSGLGGELAGVSSRMLQRYENKRNERCDDGFADCVCPGKQSVVLVACPHLSMDSEYRRHLCQIVSLGVIDHVHSFRL